MVREIGWIWQVWARQFPQTQPGVWVAMNEFPHSKENEARSMRDSVERRIRQGHFGPGHWECDLRKTSESFVVYMRYVGE